jgi:hypothetical protein
LIDDLWGLAVIGNHDRDSPFVTMSLFPSSWITILPSLRQRDMFKYEWGVNHMCLCGVY